MPEFNPTIHGNLRQPNKKGKASLENFTGKRFNRLLVFSFLGMDRNRQATWLCHCDCGKWWVTISSRLKSGQSQSCGCWNYDKTPFSKTHGKSKTRIHRIWMGMKTRIFNLTCPSSKRYGQVGMTMCKGFTEFEPFYADVGEPPTNEHSIDRYPLKKGGYWCGHCEDCTENELPKNWRWATPLEQGGNQVTNIDVTYNGETHHASEWARILGLSHDVISRRIRDGWTDAQALGFENHPSRKNVYLTHNGETMRISEWAKKLGIPRQRIASRHRNGWTDEECLSVKDLRKN